MKKSELKNFITIYLPSTPYVFVYMLQQVDYNGAELLRWANRLPDYRKVMRRRKLDRTRKALSLLLLSYGLVAALLAVVVLLFARSDYPFAVGLFMVIPAILLLFLAYGTKLGHSLLALKRRQDYAAAAEKLAKHKAVKIAVLGSYGKTTVKELLATVLSQGKKVAATPGNKNVKISHARWITTQLSGDEEVLIFEFGESEPGDIAELASFIKPDIAIVTGYAPNHIVTYGSVAALKADLASIEQFVKPENLYVLDQAAEALNFKNKMQVYGIKGAGKWQIKQVDVELSGTSVELVNGTQKVHLHTNLIGEHMAPVLALCLELGLLLGLSKEQLTTGIERTVPFEHRMQATYVSGAWVIDDTYNGNLEGIRAGLALLKKVDAARKIYVTPGLVEQGEETEKVHIEIGKLIAEAQPNIVVLMQNSVLQIIKTSIEAHGYKGEVRVEPDPLNFYTNLQYQLASGDVVLMQNDWTDNYN